MEPLSPRLMQLKHITLLLLLAIAAILIFLLSNAGRPGFWFNNIFPFATLVLLLASIFFIGKERRHLQTTSRHTNDTNKQPSPENLTAPHIEKRFQALVQNHQGIIALIDKNFNFLFRSSSATGITGWTNEEIAGIPQAYIPAGDWEQVKTTIAASIVQHGKALPFATRLKHKLGHYIWLEGTVKNMLQDPDISGIVINLQDVTRQKEAEEKITKTNRLYFFISQINQMIVKVPDEASLFKEACRIAVDTGQFKMAWIGLLDEATQYLVPQVHAGEADGYLSKLIIPAVGDQPESQGPTGSAIRQGKYTVCNDIANAPEMAPWRDDAISLGYHSSISLPIKKSGKVTGAFSLYAGANNFFNKEEIDLLQEVTADISFALEIFEKEKLRTKAEEMALKSRQEYSMLTEISPVGIFNTDASGNTTFVNPRWCQISGLSAEAALGNGWLQAVHKDDRAKLEANWLEATTKQQLSSVEYRFVHSDNSIRWVLGQATPQQNANNQTVGYVGTATDITELKNAEEKILHNEQLLIKAQQIGRLGYWHQDIGRDTIWASKQAMHIYGFPATDGTLHRDKIAACIIDLRKVKEANDELIKSHTSYNIEFAIQPADGSPVKYISAMAELEKNEQGEPVRIIGTLQDITQSKKAKEEIAKINRLYAVISGINQAIVRITDETTLFTEACRIAVEDGQFKMAWIGMTDPETSKVNPVMFAGAYSDYFNKTVAITAKDIPGGRGPTGRAVSEGKYALCNDIANDPAMAPWREAALSKGFLSSIAIPIIKFGKVVGAFTFYAPVKNFFDAAEVRLLEGATRDVAFAMENIDKEQLRKNAEHAIAKEKELSDSIINSLPGVFYLYNKDGKFLRWNKNFEQVTMYAPEEIARMHPLDFYAAGEKPLIAEKIATTLRSGEDAVQAEFLLKSGEKIPYYFTGRAIDYEGDKCLAGVGIDFTERTKAQEEIKQTTEKLRWLTDHLQNIREEERKKIGREIHDELGQQLTAINMDVAWIDKRIPEENMPVKTKLKNIIQLLNGSNQSVRRILSELRPLMLHDYGLLDAIARLAKQFTEQTDVPVQFLQRAAEVNATEQVANCIFRACQEAFTNITRYARASHVIMSVDTLDNNIRISIEDNGAGFDIASIQYGKSFGILGMKERVISLGGIFDISSVAETGTKIALSLPLKK